MNSKLVSIVVITYNSERFVAETLNSIFCQSYLNIELIISDDNSSDNTIDICKNWLQVNSDRFIKTSIVTSPKNQGIPANCNNGIKNSSGSWIKIIAGDDILLPECIEKNIEFVSKTDAEICFSKMDYIDDNNRPINRDINYDTQIIRFFKKSRMEKFKTFLYNPLFLNVPTEFFSRKLYDTCNGFDEEISLLEDQPFFYRIFSHGFDLFYFDETTVLYRKHSGSTVLKPQFVESVNLAFNKYRKPFLSKSIKGKIIMFLEKEILKRRMNNRHNNLTFRIENFLHFRMTKI